MITYCMGSARQKRDYFKDMTGAVVLDNIEVLFCASEDGRNYFAFGEIPFAGFTVSEYLNYRRAPEEVKLTDADIRAFRLSPKKRLGRLCAAQLRTVMFLELTAGKTDRPVVVNLDGAKYGRRNAAALRRLLSCLTSAYVCVTDRRFVKHARGAFNTVSFGKSATASARPAFYAAKVLAKKMGAKRVAEM
ncbi:MAG: hypothetical protein K2M48_06030 [Clostridiales bacterium]|nr:hypothetical protein [Clostridiales bacterium]